MIDSILLFAQEKGKDGKQNTGGGFDMLQWMLPIVLIFGVFYLLIIRPQRRREQQMREQLNALKKNDKVVTHSGIVGVVANISDKEDEVTLRLEEGKMKIVKTAIARILTEEKKESAAEKK